jgi:hypothetical protein
MHTDLSTASGVRFSTPPSILNPQASWLYAQSTWVTSSITSWNFVNGEAISPCRRHLAGAFAATGGSDFSSQRSVPACAHPLPQVKPSETCLPRHPHLQPVAYSASRLISVALPPCSKHTSQPWCQAMESPIKPSFCHPRYRGESSRSPANPSLQRYPGHLGPPSGRKQ